MVLARAGYEGERAREDGMTRFFSITHKGHDIAFMLTVEGDMEKLVSRVLQDDFIATIKRLTFTPEGALIQEKEKTR